MFCIEEEGKFQVQNQRKIQTQTQYSIFNAHPSHLKPHPSKIINNATYYHQYH